MRVRPRRTTITRRIGRGAHPARSAPVADQPAVPAAEAAAAVDAHPHERRARESGGPIDRATYTCGCGMVFDAPVSTSVSCPHCGTGQAW